MSFLSFYMQIDLASKNIDFVYKKFFKKINS